MVLEMKKNLNWVTLLSHCTVSTIVTLKLCHPHRLHFNPLLRALSSSTIPKPNDKSINYKNYCCNIYLIKFVEVNIGRSQCLCRLGRDKQNNQGPEIERPIESVVPNLNHVVIYLEYLVRIP